MAATATGASQTSGSAVYTEFGSSSTTASGSDGSGGSSAAQIVAVGIGRTYGTAIVLSAVFGGFVML